MGLPEGLNYRRRERDVGPRDLDAERFSSDPNSFNQQTGMAAEETEYYADSPPVQPPPYAPSRPSAFRSNAIARRKPSFGKRLFRAVARFVIAVAIGVGGTLGWQAYGNEAMDIVAIWAPSLGPWLPAATAASPAPAVTLADVVEQIKPISVDLAIVRRSLDQLAANQEQLAAKQDQTTRSVAALQQVEQDIRQQISSVSMSQPAHTAPRKPVPAAPPLQPLH
jgi:hypothetical protein